MPKSSSLDAGSSHSINSRRTRRSKSDDCLGRSSTHRKLKRQDSERSVSSARSAKSKRKGKPVKKLLSGPDDADADEDLLLGSSSHSAKSRRRSKIDKEERRSERRRQKTDLESSNHAPSLQRKEGIRKKKSSRDLVAPVGEEVTPPTHKDGVKKHKDGIKRKKSSRNIVAEEGESTKTPANPPTKAKKRGSFRNLLQDDSSKLSPNHLVDYDAARALIAARYSNSPEKSPVKAPEVPPNRRRASGRLKNSELREGAYDDALAKVAARFSSEDSRASGKIRSQRRQSRKLDVTPNDKVQPSDENNSRPVRRSSRKSLANVGYDEALKRVAARFSADGTPSSGKEVAKRRSSRRLLSSDATFDEPESSRSTETDMNEDDKSVTTKAVPTGITLMKRRSSRRLLSDDASVNTQESTSYDDALRKVASRYTDANAPQKGISLTRRLSSRRLLSDLGPDNTDGSKEAPQKAGVMEGSSQSGKVIGNARPAVRRLSSRRLMTDAFDSESNEPQQIAAPQTSKSEEVAPVVPIGPRVDRKKFVRQYSDDSLDFDTAIAQELDRDEQESPKRLGLGDSRRRLQRSGSDNSIELQHNDEQPQRGVRRSNSADQPLFNFDRTDSVTPKVSASKKSPEKTTTKKKPRMKVSFKEDKSAKRGVAVTVIDSEGPISLEEKVAGWYNGRDFKGFKAVCSSEAVDARSNPDYTSHFQKVWKACSSEAIDFAWQELMAAEHKKSSPNSAVLLSKAKCRGFERDIFPESLLRPRVHIMKAVVKAHENAMLSMTASPEEQAESLRSVSVKLSQPFRRFARVMAEGDGLLVAAWERVAKKKKKKALAEGSDLTEKETKKEAEQPESDTAPNATEVPTENRRALLESSVSCRRMLHSDPRENNSSNGNHTPGDDSDGRRALLESSVSSRKLVSSLSRSLDESMLGPPARSDSDRDLLNMRHALIGIKHGRTNPDDNDEANSARASTSFRNLDSAKETSRHRRELEDDIDSSIRSSTSRRGNNDRNDLRSRASRLLVNQQSESTRELRRKAAKARKSKHMEDEDNMNDRSESPPELRTGRGRNLNDQVLQQEDDDSASECSVSPRQLYPSKTRGRISYEEIGGLSDGSINRSERSDSTRELRRNAAKGRNDNAAKGRNDKDADTRSNDCLPENGRDCRHDASLRQNSDTKLASGIMSTTDDPVSEKRQGYLSHYLPKKDTDDSDDAKEQEPSTPTRGRRGMMTRRGSSRRLLVATPSQRRKASMRISVSATPSAA